MLEILSTLNNLTRIDLTLDAAGWVLASGVIGSWVSPTGTGQCIKVAAAGNFGFPIWSESNRSSSLAGFSPDIAATGKITVLYGKIRARTDQYDGTPAIGSKLYLSVTGTLSTTAGSSAHQVAVCTKAQYSHDVKFQGAITATNVIEYVTI